MGVGQRGYWSEEAQILYARDMAARIIQNNWRKNLQ